MSKLTAYKLSDKGEALVRAAKDDKKPQKGIIVKNGVKIDLQNLDDDSAKLIENSGYVESVKPAKSTS